MLNNTIAIVLQIVLFYPFPLGITTEALIHDPILMSAILFDTVGVLLLQQY